jgi:hypothetical protein
MTKDKKETHFFITLPVKCVIRNKSAGKQPSSCSFLQFDNSVTINDLRSHWYHVWWMIKCKGSKRKKHSLNEWPSWHLAGGKEDKHIHLRMVASQPRFNRPLQIQVYRIAATTACLVSSSVHTFVQYMCKINLCKEPLVNLFHLSSKILCPTECRARIDTYIYSKNLLQPSFCKNSINP